MTEPSEQGMPNLQYGTANGPLPDGWKLEHRTTLGVLFACQFPFVDATSKSNCFLVQDAMTDSWIS